MGDISFSEILCPQYYEFGQNKSDNGDSYFEVDHESPPVENKLPKNKGSLKKAPLCSKSGNESMQNSFQDSPGPKNMSLSEEENYYPVIMCNTSNLSKKRKSSCVSEVPKKRSKKGNSNTAPKVTVVKPFNFATEKRVKANENSPPKQVDFVRALRSNTLKNGRGKVLRSTVPKPFNFHSKNSGSAPDVKIQTLGESVQAFLNKTPERFHTKAANAVPQSYKVSVPELVMPQSPKLEAVKRHRPITAISHEQAEEMEIQKMKEYRFHAQPFNKRLLSSPQLVKPQVKPPTKPLDIHLETERRTSQRNKDVPREEPYVFRAQEVPKNIFKRPVGLKAKRPASITDPASPVFALKKRSEQWSNMSVFSEDQNTSVNFKANPAPRSDAPFTIKHDKKFTMAEPFSFEQFDKERMMMKEKKIQEEIENERKRAEFHARPLPASVISPRPLSSNSVSKKPPTEPEPFSFLLEKLAEKKAEKSDEQLSFSATQFKAQPALVIKKLPFVPKVTHKATVVTAEPCLNTEKRAAERMKLRERQQRMEAEMEALAAQRNKELEEKEKEELKQLRNALVHKANPIRNYQPVQIKYSLRPLTKPKSPKFATDLRLGNKTILQ